MTRMRALVKAERKPGIWLVEDAPVPEVGVHEVMIRIRKTAICGTDVHIYNWDAWSQKTIPVPMIVGHKYFGVVEKVGDEVEAFRPGDRVSGEGHITCGFCRNCRAGRRHLCRHTVGVGVNRPGSFAELLVIPAENVYRIPDDIPDEIASIFDPYGNAAHTALSFDLVGEDVLVTGAGPIGIMAAAVARHAGARFVVITDVNPYRLELARNVQSFALLPGDYTVQLSGDWYRGDLQLCTTPIDDPDTASPLGEMHVGAPYGRMFMDGSLAYVASDTGDLYLVEAEDASGQRLNRLKDGDTSEAGAPNAPELYQGGTKVEIGPDRPAFRDHPRALRARRRLLGLLPRPAAIICPLLTASSGPSRLASSPRRLGESDARNVMILASL